MKKRLESLGWGLGLVLVGVLAGRIWALEVPAAEVTSVRPEIAIMTLNSLRGDELELEIFGPVRITWGESQILDQEGVQRIPLGQIADQIDLQFKSFAYTANAKTGKFYPSNSYPARGTAVVHRRFFQTKEGAIEAGFIPTKLVK